MDALAITTESPAETENEAARLASLLAPGDTITLSGDLGAGKTCFVRGLVTALSSCQGEMVASPTYAIMNEYSGDIPVYHIDCYRLKGADDAVELGFDELFQGRGISVVEWPERIAPLLPEDRLDIFFEYRGENERLIRYSPHGDRFEEVVSQLL